MSVSPNVVGMTWREIEDLYLSGAGRGGSPDTRAAKLRFRFLTEALRLVAGAIKPLPDLFGRVDISTTANQDWVPAPDDCYAIDWIQNRTGGHRLKQEPEGMRGRAKYFVAATDKPATGEIESVNFYWHETRRIYLRDTPNEIGVLDVSYYKHPMRVTEDDLELTPPIGAQYHFALAETAIGLYYSLHPPLDPNTQTPMMGYGQSRVSGALASVGGVKHQREQENRDRRKVMTQPGYTMGGCR